MSQDPLAKDPFATAGVYEFLHGYPSERRDQTLKFWALLGFEPVAEQALDAAGAQALYGHASAVTSIRLAHAGCASFGTGHVRLQFWETPRNAGLDICKPLDVGSRWMGIYCRDILSVAEAFADTIATHGKDWFLSPLVRASIVQPEPAYSLDALFVGLRELVVLGDDFRFAFVQRAGFDRPGFGTFNEALPFRNTEGTHANVIQPVGQFSTDFYKAVFGLVTMPYGDAKDSGSEASTIAALDLAPGQTFRIERLLRPGCPAGMLQVYAPYSDAADRRQDSRPGSVGLAGYSYAVRDIEDFRATVLAHGGSSVTPVLRNEFDEPSLCFDAPDGVAWTVVAA